MKKKTVSILLMAAMAPSLAACGFSNSTDSSSKSSSKAESTSASSASSEAESASSAKSTADGEVFDDTTVTVFAAKSLNSVMETLISEYNKTQPNVKLVGSYDSSGTLMTQIEEGASCDVFFSAAAKQMDQLEEENLLVEGTRHNIVNNQVCVVTYEGSNTEVTGLEDLNKASSIALADGSVPVGKYTREALVNAGILEKADDVSAITTQQVSEALGGAEKNDLYAVRGTVLCRLCRYSSGSRHSSCILYDQDCLRRNGTLGIRHQPVCSVYECQNTGSYYFCCHCSSDLCHQLFLGN